MQPEHAALHVESVLRLQSGQDLRVALRMAADVLRAFPKMLEALEPFATIAEHHRRAGYAESRREDRRDVLHGFHLVPGESVELRLSDCTSAGDALRVAREALDPATPPQRCTDTVTEWTDTEERTVPCNHPLPCPLHTPRAAREAVEP